MRARSLIETRRRSENALVPSQRARLLREPPVYQVALEVITYQVPPGAGRDQQGPQHCRWLLGWAAGEFTPT